MLDFPRLTTQMASRDTVEIEIFMSLEEGGVAKPIPATFRKDRISAYWPSLENPNHTYMIVEGRDFVANVTYERLKAVINDFSSFLENITEPIFGDREQEYENG